jgi:hypothetical protein
MPYLILKSCVAGGSRRSAGDIIELDKAEANQLLIMGRVEAVAEAKLAQETDRSVGLQADVASPLKKRGRKQ